MPEKNKLDCANCEDKKDCSVEMFCGRDITPKEPKLKPCPLCGGEVELGETTIEIKNAAYLEYAINCLKCPLVLHGEWDTTKERIIAHWNKRVGEKT